LPTPRCPPQDQRPRLRAYLRYEVQAGLRSGWQSG
jgi:hypothetical protein